MHRMRRPRRQGRKNRTRLIVGGDQINYPGDVGTPTAFLLTVKLLVNSVMSTAGVEFMTLDIKHFYLNTPLARYEYLRLKLTNLPEDVIEEYGLKEKETKDGYVYVEIRKGHVWSATGRHHRQSLTYQATGTPRLLPMPAHTWPVETQVAPDPFFFGRQRLWHQVRRQTTRRPFNCCNRRTL